MSDGPLVHVVDDDPDIREALAMLLSSVDLEVRTYASADAFLSAPAEPHRGPACMLLDVRMPGMSGMALLERLNERGTPPPIIVMTGHGDIDMAVRAMKLGAMDFVTKPLAPQALLEKVQDLLRRGPPTAEPVGEAAAAVAMESLTSRERQIFDRLVAGASNKAIALDLEISIRTVETHRARIMAKLNAKSLVDLVLIAVAQPQNK